MIMENIYLLLQLVNKEVIILYPKFKNFSRLSTPAQFSGDVISHNEKNKREKNMAIEEIC